MKNLLCAVAAISASLCILCADAESIATSTDLPESGLVSQTFEGVEQTEEPTENESIHVIELYLEGYEKITVNQGDTVQSAVILKTGNADGKTLNPFTVTVSGNVHGLKLEKLDWLNSDNVQVNKGESSVSVTVANAVVRSGKVYVDGRAMDMRISCVPLQQSETESTLRISVSGANEKLTEDKDGKIRLKTTYTLIQSAETEEETEGTEETEQPEAL